MKNIMKAAHKMTREIIEKYNDVDYKTQLGLCMSYLLENKEEEKVEKVAITKGSEKQIAWAEDIRNQNIRTLEREIEELKLREVDGTGSFPELIAKLEKAVKELLTVEKPAKFYIEHNNLANAYIYKLKHTK
jgi:hypothetical protein